MAQVYAQRAGQPDAWVMSGAPAATAIWLSRDTPINYSDGTTDTVLANTPAQVVGGGTSFNRTNDVFVPFIYKGDPTLRIIKEALLPTLTSDYHPMARVELHGIKPYQPEPYLAAGGLGNVADQSVVVCQSQTAAKAHTLWNGSSNDAPPSGWETPAFDDSAWAAAVHPPGAPSVGDGSTNIWSSTSALALHEEILSRQAFTLPAGTIHSAALLAAEQSFLSIYINGTLVYGAGTGGTSIAVPASVLRAGGAANTIAAHHHDDSAAAGDLVFPAYFHYTLTVQMAGSSSVLLDPGGHEGDLLYYHDGAWSDLPIGTSGQELTVVAGDPAWATPAAGYSDPLTTKGDLLTRSSSATVRLGVGSNGQVVTADSTVADGIKWATPSASGVTSIDVAVPAPLSAAGGPVTSSGTITLSWASGQTANRVLASPDGTTGAVSLRALVAGDIPSLPASQITSGQLAQARGGTGLDTSAATDGQLLIGQSSDHSLGLAALVAGSGITVTNAGHSITIASSGGGGSGTVTSVALSLPGIFSVSGSPITTAGTLSASLASQSPHTFWGGPASGSAAAPTFRALQSSDVPAATGAGGRIHAHGHFI